MGLSCENIVETYSKISSHEHRATPDPVKLLNEMFRSTSQRYKREAWRFYFDAVPELSADLPVPFLGIMVLIWQIRDKDLQEKFPLDSKQSRLDYIAWCIFHGVKEYAIFAEAENFWQALDKPVGYRDHADEDNIDKSITWRLYFLAKSRADLNIDLEIVADRRKFLAWYLLHGSVETGWRSVLSQQQIEYLSANSTMEGLNRAQEAVYLSRPDVIEAFPFPSSQREYKIWFENNIPKFPNIFFVPEVLVTSHFPERDIASFKPGVNVVGYAYGELGIGEDSRMATKAFVAAGVPVGLLNFSPGSNVSERDVSMKSYVLDKPQYKVNMFCLTALEHARYFVTNGTYTIVGRHSIGYWPWELSTWPEEWEHLLSLVDEVWASSLHTYNALAPVASIKVKRVPMCVETGPISNLTRDDFLLPSKSFLFLFSFDLNSSAKRKNPKACLDAFMSAFPMSKNSDDVGLVIKVHPPKEENAEWKSLKELSLSDPRIRIVEQTLSRPDLMALYRVCNCFISLHRAEGFGRNIAETMLLGLPVLTSAYSGNLDFTSPHNSYLVQTWLVKLAENDYPYGSGQVWGEPSVQHASRLMRKIFEDQEATRAVARHAAEKINASYSANVIGAIYKRELCALVAS